MIDDEGRVVHEVVFAHPIERVWAAIVDREALARWLMPNDFEARVGHRFQLDARPPRGLIDAEVAALDPPHRLVLRWMLDGAATTVTITLQEVPEGTLLRLVHSDIPPDPRPRFDTGWVEKLEALEALL